MVHSYSPESPFKLLLKSDVYTCILYRFLMTQSDWWSVYSCKDSKNDVRKNTGKLHDILYMRLVTLRNEKDLPCVAHGRVRMIFTPFSPWRAHLISLFRNSQGASGCWSYSQELLWTCSGVKQETINWSDGLLFISADCRPPVTRTKWLQCLFLLKVYVPCSDMLSRHNT